jgi:hypothetical protein
MNLSLIRFSSLLTRSQTATGHGTAQSTYPPSCSAYSPARCALGIQNAGTAGNREAPH